MPFPPPLPGIPSGFGPPVGGIMPTALGLQAILNQLLPEIRAWVMSRQLSLQEAVRLDKQARDSMRRSQAPWRLTVVTIRSGTHPSRAASLLRGVDARYRQIMDEELPALPAHLRMQALKMCEGIDQNEERYLYCMIGAIDMAKARQRAERERARQQQERKERQERLDKTMGQVAGQQKTLDEQRAAERQLQLERIRERQRARDDWPPLTEGTIGQSYDRLRGNARSLRNLTDDDLLGMTRDQRRRLEIAQRMCRNDPTMWFCDDDKEVVVRDRLAHEQNLRSQATAKRMERQPPALRPRGYLDEVERERRTAGMREWRPFRGRPLGA